MSVAIYAGTFDPVTLGHLDIIFKACKIFDKIIVAVAEHNNNRSNTSKKPMFDTTKRIEMINRDLSNLNILSKNLYKQIEVTSFDGLLTTFAKKKKAKILVRGIRVTSDLEYELQMSSLNSQLSPDIITMLLLPSESTQFISSRFVKEIAMFGGDLSSLVTDDVAKDIKIACKQQIE